MILGDLSRTPQAVCECHDSFTLASLEDTHRRWLSIPRSQPTKYPGPKLPHSKTAGWGLERRASHDGWPLFMPQTQDFEPSAWPLQSHLIYLPAGWAPFSRASWISFSRKLREAAPGTWSVIRPLRSMKMLAGSPLTEYLSAIS
jgi:hypothetical protein